MRHQRFALLIVCSLLACESTGSPEMVYEHTVTPAMVTGAALAALRTDGHFNLETPATGPDQVSLADAKAQALEFARYVTNNVLLRGVVEGERGGYWSASIRTAMDPAHVRRRQRSADDGSGCARRQPDPVRQRRAHEVFVAALTCSRLDVQPYLHVPTPEQPSVVLLDHNDSAVDPPRTWLVEVQAIAPIRFEIGTLSESG